MANYIDHELYSNYTSYYWPAFLNNNSSNLTGVYDSVVSDVAGVLSQDCQKWVFSITGWLLVGLSGVFPLLIFPQGGCSTSTSKQNSCSSEDDSGVDKTQLRRLLNFAVGSLLGDIFLHLLPEAWNHARESGSSRHESLMFLGFWILIGLVSFVICEKLVTIDNEEESKGSEANSQPMCKIIDSSNNNVAKISTTDSPEPPQHNIHNILAGYLNLIANTFDNFTHGLAVAGSFIICVFTTTAILLHEIPHEIADFAILLRSGFGRLDAAKSQLSTAAVGLAGVDCMQTMGDFTWWILPFTSGCFLNIALTNLLPDLMKEDNPKESVKQFASLLLGIAVMGSISLMHECQLRSFQED